ncbi:MAG: aldo/keto reductase [Eubacteriales bacterium]|nr:aldo/keto reductase [Eubacteriales bacterium]
MQRMLLGKTGLEVARVGLGTAGYGAGMESQDAHAQMDFYVAQGGNFIDTARCYNDWIPGERSRSEKIIGQWLRSRGGRQHVVLVTKGGHPPFTDLHASRLSPQEVDADLDGSLRDLGTDYIDLYFLHRDDVRRPVDEILEHLEEKVRQGKIRHYGASNWTLARLRQADAYAARHGLQGFAVNQLGWSLAQRSPDAPGDDTLVYMDAPLFDYHTRTGMAAMAFSSQGKGYFPRAAGGGVTGEDATVFDTPRNRRVLQVLQDISRQTGIAIATLVVHHIIASPFPAVPLVSSRSNQRLLAALAAGDLPADAPWRAQLEEAARL